MRGGKTRSGEIGKMTRWERREEGVRGNQPDRPRKRKESCTCLIFAMLIPLVSLFSLLVHILAPVHFCCLLVVI